MSQPRLKLVWVNGTWLPTLKKSKVNASAKAAKRVSRLVRGWAWLRMNGSAVSAIILFLAVPWYLGKLYIQLETTDQALYGDAGLIERVNGLQNDLIWMKGFVTDAYREIAVAQGYKKDEFKMLPLRFSESRSTGRLLFQAAQTSAGLQYDVEVALVSANREEIVLSVNRQFGRSDFKNHTVNVPVSVGAAVELTEQVYVEGMRRVFLDVLALPTQDTAIIAIGSKRSASS